MEVTGKAKITNVKKYGDLTRCGISIGKKNQDGTWLNTYINAIFVKGSGDSIPENYKGEITIRHSFFSVNEYQGNTSLQLIIMKIEPLVIAEKVEQKKAYVQNDKDDDIPF